MNGEGSESKIARIDERTLGMDAKLDKFIEAHEKHREAQDEKIAELFAWKNWLAGAIAALGAVLGIHSYKGH